MNQRRPGPKELRPERPSLPAISLILLGLLLGLGGALYYAWVLNPVVLVDASPARFSPEYKAEYILLVSQNLAADGDVARAEQRLEALGEANVTQTVSALLEQFVRERRPSAHVTAIANLAQKLGVESQAVALFAPTPSGGLPPTPTATATAVMPTPTIAQATPLPSPTLMPTDTPAPTLEPSPTPQPNYRLLNQQRVCEDGPAPRLEVVTFDALLAPLAGVEVLVNWEGGSDHFVTGFKPEQGEGYGDFTMTADTTYTVQLADGSPTVGDLRVETCEATGLPGGWRLTFQNLVLRSP
ncbi:MAG: hypothetical protein H6658_07360 [Ardenticatenaceae bacterium]|nr:hypothetical protein [Ardenticatenaceae bacterium]